MLSLLIQPLHAQELTSRRTQADRLFDRAEYFKSIDLYLKLAETDKPQPSVIERVADCYRLMNNYEQAEEWYAKTVALKGIKPISIFYYAEVLLRNKKFDKAREQYKRYYLSGPKDQLDLKLAACDSAVAWSKQEGYYKVINEKKMSSVYADWGVSYLDKKNVIFTSDRSTSDYKGDKGIYNRTGNEWLKMFTYDLDHNYAEELVFDNSGDINLTKDYHTGPMAINATGDTAYITVTTRLSTGSLPDVKTPFDQHLYIRRLELILATKKSNGKWGNLKKFPYNNVNAYSIGHASLSKNGQVLYFTSDMPGGYGKTDIWYSQKGSDGKWGKPINCGSTINTTADEAFPSVGEKDKLYFSSKGLPGMGGFDVFSARGSGSTWSVPVNLKYPLNSTSDDFCFVTNDGKTGYLASDRQGGQGNDDIYSFTYTGPDDKPLVSQPIANTTPAINKAAMGAPAPGELPVSAPPVITSSSVPTGAPAGMITLEGTVFDNANNQPLDSVTVLLKNAKGQTIGGGLALSTQKFSFSIAPGQEYIIEARKKGFFPSTQKVSTIGLNPSSTSYLTANLKMVIEPLAVGKTFIIRNIYYDLNRANIRADAMVELDKLVAIMRENPTMRIELSSHTDSRGSDYYNMLLSDARAISAVAYMKRRGIAADRMVAIGYGETRLLNECANGVKCSEDDHQFNRRTEIKVLSGMFK
jgi:outer membrane protein OmpA-like peptidoglycan-associated protein/tetratricopeptide (TPR) repeat protein